MPNQFVSADHIAAAQGAFEPQRKNNFTVVLPVGGRVIQQSLHSFPLPKESNEVITIPFGNEKRKVAGPANFGAMALVLKDFVDKQTLKSLVEWRREVYKPNEGTIGYAKTYKKTGEVWMLGPEGSPVRKWKIYGVWPSDLNPGEATMESGAQNMITVTLEVDKAVEMF